MITIISGTNRNDNTTKKVAREYQRLLSEKNVETSIFALDEISVEKGNPDFERAVDQLLKAADQFIIIMPEYNGSYPGILKLMIDNTPVRETWWHKKVLMTGVSTGRAGNLRGMEHLTGVLLHMKMLVHPNRLPISLVDKLMDAEGKFTDIPSLAAIDTQLEEFLDF
jgi:chromate reductase